MAKIQKVPKIQKIRRALAAALLTGLVLLSACSGAESPAETTARGFMDAYYVRADLQKASEFADSLALDKVNSGMSLRDGFAIDAAAHHPKIRYELTKASVAGDRGEFLFEVAFRPEKAEAFHKQARIIVRRKDGGPWKVTQFSDHDPL